MEESGLARNELGHTLLGAALGELPRKGDVGCEELLGPKPCRLGQLRIQLCRDQVLTRVHPHIAQDEQRLPRLHPAAVAHEDFAHDAALLVLHRLAVHVDLDEAGGDDGTRKGRERLSTQRCRV